MTTPTSFTGTHVTFVPSKAGRYPAAFAATVASTTPTRGGHINGTFMGAPVALPGCTCG